MKYRQVQHTQTQTTVHEETEQQAERLLLLVFCGSILRDTDLRSWTSVPHSTKQVQGEWKIRPSGDVTAVAAPRADA